MVNKLLNVVSQDIDKIDLITFANKAIPKELF
jgi:hypothetical protein